MQSLKKTSKTLPEIMSLKKKSKYSNLSRTMAIDFLTDTVRACNFLDVCKLHMFK